MDAQLVDGELDSLRTEVTTALARLDQLQREIAARGERQDAPQSSPDTKRAVAMRPFAIAGVTVGLLLLLWWTLSARRNGQSGEFLSVRA